MYIQYIKNCYTKAYKCTLLLYIINGLNLNEHGKFEVYNIIIMRVL